MRRWNSHVWVLAMGLAVGAAMPGAATVRAGEASISGQPRQDQAAPLDPLAAAETTLSGINTLHPAIDQVMTEGDLPRLKAMLADIGTRIDAARNDFEDAFRKADRQRKDQLHEVGWRIEAARKLFFIPWALLSYYEYPTGKPTESIKDSTRRGFKVIEELLPRLRDLRMPAGGVTVTE
jgi:hypothetical protein